MTYTCRAACWLIAVCGGAGGRAPWRLLGDGSRHDWGVFCYLASAKLIACLMSPNPKTTQKPTTVPPHIFVNNGRIGRFQVPILCSCTVGRHMSHLNKRFVHLGGGVAWWSIRNHGQIVLWPSIILLRKLAIYYNYIWYTPRTTDF